MDDATLWPRHRPKDVVIDALNPDGMRLLDIGCGGGRWMRVLADRGAQVTGLEIDAERVALAERAGAGPVECGLAEALPFADSMFDGALFLNSLHHVPIAEHDRALSEARRVLVQSGHIGVLEPVAEGAAQEVYRFIDDEVEVRAAALAALRRAAASDGLELVHEREFFWPALYGSVDDVLNEALAVDPSRRDPIERNHTEIVAAFARHGRPGERGVELDQPYRFTLLRRL